MVGGSLDKALGQGTQSPGRAIAHHEPSIGGFVELEFRNVGAGIDLADLGVDDVIDTQDEEAGGWLEGKKSGISLEEQGDRLLAEPA